MMLKQGSVLRDLIEKHNVKRFAEIGVWKSDTIKVILNDKPDCLKEYWAIDPWLRKTDPVYGHYCTQTQEEWDKLHDQCCNLISSFPVLKVIRVGHEEASTLFPKQYFDTVFLDADHFLEGTCSQIDHWLPLVKVGGLLTGHDYISRTPETRMAVKLKFRNDYELMRATIWMHRKKKKVNGINQH